MFYCDPCRIQRCWPESIMRSRGRCELCGTEASCNDVQSRNLPEPRSPTLRVVPPPTTEVTPERPRKRGRK